MELFDESLNQAVRSVTGLDAEEWLVEKRAISRTLRTAADFPIATVCQCAAIEQKLSKDDASILRYYVWLASGCLTSSFILTQRDAAIRRIESSSNSIARSPLLVSIADGNAFVTVGISHLTTSRRHLSKGPLLARLTPHGWLLNGYSPWVTGGNQAAWFIVGATIETNEKEPKAESQPQEMIVAIPSQCDGVTVEPCAELMALTASATGPVRFDNVFVDDSQVLHGPIANVMTASGSSGGAGGLQTSALAIGHAAQAIQYLEYESQVRTDLRPVVERFKSQWLSLYSELLAINKAESTQNAGGFRKLANDLALNSTQAALIAAKGTGYMNDHEVGRWCREALFFLVWSCPQSVVQSHLCSLAT